MKRIANHPELMQVMQQSRTKQHTLISLATTLSAPQSAANDMALRMCLAALEQAGAVRLVAASGLVTAAAGLLRTLFETVTRAAWLVYAGEGQEHAVKEMIDSLKESDGPAPNPLPDAAAMLATLHTHPADRGAQTVLKDLCTMQTVSWHTAQSFVYGAISQRIFDGDADSDTLAARLIAQSLSLLDVTGLLLHAIRDDDAASPR